MAGCSGITRRTFSTIPLARAGIRLDKREGRIG